MGKNVAFLDKGQWDICWLKKKMLWDLVAVTAGPQGAGWVGRVVGPKEDSDWAWVKAELVAWAWSGRRKLGEAEGFSWVAWADWCRCGWPRRAGKGAASAGGVVGRIWALAEWAGGPVGAGW